MVLEGKNWLNLLDQIGPIWSNIYILAKMKGQFSHSPTCIFLFKKKRWTGNIKSSEHSSEVFLLPEALAKLS